MSGTKKSYTKNAKIPRGSSLRKKVFALFDENPLYNTKTICEKLLLSYKDYRNYIYQLRHEWKFLPSDERGSKPSSVHAWRGWTYLPSRELDAAGQRVWVRAVMTRCLAAGWKPTTARNRWILWKDKLGRLQLFETGRINVYVRKPPTLGRAWQLICNGFTFTGVITDLKELEVILNGYRWKGGVRMKSAHYLFETKQPLPKLTIDFFEKSNGVIIKVGDRSHPTSVEVIASYPDWAERNERMMGDFLEVMTRLLESRGSQVPMRRPKEPYIA